MKSSFLPEGRPAGAFWANYLISCESKVACKFSKKKYQQNQLIEIYPSTLSKRDFKHSGTFLFNKLHATLDSQLMTYFAQKAPAGRLSGSKYIPKIHIHDTWQQYIAMIHGHGT